MSISNIDAKNTSTKSNIIVSDGYPCGNGNTSVQNTLNVSGEIRAPDIKLNGISVEERLSTIEKVLNIPTRDAIMEEKYPKLREIYDQYRYELEKYKTWQRIKDKQ